MAVLATLTLMTKKKTKEELEWVSCIWYLVIFKNLIEALLNSESKVNAINKAFPSQIGLKIWKTNVRAQKTKGTTLETYKMVVSIFFVLDKSGKKSFCQESFLLANDKPDVVLEIPF